MPILIEPEVQAMRNEIIAIVPEREWGIWLNEYDHTEIHYAITLLARYFVEDAFFTEIPKSHEFQLKGRISQNLYILKRMDALFSSVR